MDPRLILKFTMLFVVNTNVVPCNVISNFRLDSIFNTKQKAQLMNKYMLLNTRLQFKNRLSNTKFSNPTTWTIMTLPGTNTD